MVDRQAIRAKQRARKLALQALYQWCMSQHELTEIEAQFRAVNSMHKVDEAYFVKLLYGIPKELPFLEEQLLPFLDRPLDQLNPIELTTLRIGSYELFYCPEIPYRVVLDESVTLTREFGSQDGHRYVNGVLNNLARQVRKLELGDE